VSQQKYRRKVSITDEYQALFADINGSTETDGDLDPRKKRARLSDEALELMLSDLQTTLPS